LLLPLSRWVMDKTPLSRRPNGWMVRPLKS
jgi:hypothetical protein